MNVACRTRSAAIGLCIAVFLTAPGAVATPDTDAASLALPPCPSGSSADDVEAIASRLRLALRTQPYLFDRHIEVSVDKGVVVMRGIVYSDWDLLTAISVANRSACSRRVVDDLSIQVGGLR